MVPAADIAEEYYVSFLVDRGTATTSASPVHAGGVEIEEVAHTNPDAIAQGLDRPGRRRRHGQGARDRRRPPASPRTSSTRGRLHRRSDRVFIEEDATLVEVNPLAKLGDGPLEALDGKVTLDENADFRHPDHAKYADAESSDPLETKAKAKDLNYVKLDGAVGIIGNGAGPGDVHARRGRLRR